MSTFKHTIVAVAVWGEVHRRRFTERFLPSLLNALPKDKNELRPRLVIFTTAEDWEFIKERFGYPNIREAMAARMAQGREEPEVIKFIPGPHNGTSMVVCQKEALGIAYRERSALSWLYPDCWYMPGSFDAVVARVSQHVRACMYTCGSVEEEAAFRIIDSIPAPKDQADRDQLAWWLYEKIHPTTLARAWTEDGKITGNTIHPGMLFRLPTPDLPLLVMNAFHHSPIWVWPRRLSTDFIYSLDGDFIEHAGLSIEEIDVVRRGFWVTACDEATKVDAMDAVTDGVTQRSTEPLSALHFKAWVQRYTTPINRMMFGVPLVLARDPSAEIRRSDEAELLTRLARQAHEMMRLT